MVQSRAQHRHRGLELVGSVRRKLRRGFIGRLQAVEAAVQHFRQPRDFVVRRGHRQPLLRGRGADPLGRRAEVRDRGDRPPAQPVAADEHDQPDHRQCQQQAAPQVLLEELDRSEPGTDADQVGAFLPGTDPAIPPEHFDRPRLPGLSFEIRAAQVVRAVKDLSFGSLHHQVAGLQRKRDEFPGQRPPRVHRRALEVLQVAQELVGVVPQRFIELGHLMEIQDRHQHRRACHESHHGEQRGIDADFHLERPFLHRGGCIT